MRLNSDVTSARLVVGLLAHIERFSWDDTLPKESLNCVSSSQVAWNLCAAGLIPLVVCSGGCIWLASFLVIQLLLKRWILTFSTYLQTDRRTFIHTD